MQSTDLHSECVIKETVRCDQPGPGGRRVAQFEIFKL
jgi:hypothetical protein